MTLARSTVLSGVVEGGLSGGGTYLTGPGPHTPAGLVRYTMFGAGTGAIQIPGGAGNDIAQSATRNLDDVAPTPSGVVYHRTDELGGKPYVGQAKDWDRYEARQLEHTRDNPDALFSFDVLGRAEPGVPLDRLEERWIRELGGPTNKSNPDGLLANKRHQMSDQRYEAAGGDPLG